MADQSPSSKVKFTEDTGDKPTLIKHVPTQKYNRQEIQKRLDVESWMDDQLKELFQSEEYPQLDIDDVQKISASDREERLKTYLSDAKKPVEAFIKELLIKVQDIKPIST